MNETKQNKQQKSEYSVYDVRIRIHRHHLLLYIHTFNMSVKMSIDHSNFSYFGTDY